MDNKNHINPYPGIAGIFNHHERRVTMKSAEETIRLIEMLYPNWARKFENLSEAIKYHTSSQELVISRLRKHNEDLRNQLNLKKNA